MTALTPLRNVPEKASFQKGDVFVLFGELFNRGYANGLLEMARKAEMQIIGMTVGRRDENKNLRPLTTEELSIAEENLGGKIINIPLEAGFDLDTPEGGTSPVDLLKSMKLDNFEETQLDWDSINRSREIGTERFCNSLDQVAKELEALLPEGKNVFFAHTMAGGIPRAKIFMVVANRVYKGKGKRFIKSERYWKSDLGKLSAICFDEVTANTFSYLINATENIRNKVSSSGGEVFYSAYGYHGTEILINGEYQWQTYTPYQQGHAKKRLEQIAESAWEKGIKAVVYNCPEIRTNSSTVFAGVEIPLFSFLKALKKENAGELGEEIFQNCQSKLKDGQDLNDLLQIISDYLKSPVFQNFQNYEAWPMENSAELAEIMVGTSDQMQGLHLNRKDLITDLLSELILIASGTLIFNEISHPQGPVLWLGHDVIAKQLIDSNINQ
ncbi:MAG: hypothetical protein ACI86H_000879 [bacterium]|jgi:hypothetical protein